jgi:leader peptidase (prepilin peptidase)/N-methyltransferase
MNAVMTPRRLNTPARLAATIAAGACVEGLVAWRFGWSVPLMAYLVFGGLTVAVSELDLTTRRVPNRLVLIGYVLGGTLLALASATSGGWWALERSCLALVVLGGFYLALALGFPSGMGMGDCKWAGVTGMFLGWLSWTAVSTGTLIAFAAAAVFVVARRTPDSRSLKRAVVPLAPFMSIGSIIAVVGVR